MIPVRRLGVLLAAGLTLTACTSSSGAPTPPGTSAAAPSVPVPSLTSPSSSVPAPSTSALAPSTTAPASSSPAPTTASAAPKSTCTRISVRVLPGGAEHGEEIAAVQYTNAGSVACQLVGYPTVTLLRSGQRIGSASLPSTPGIPSVRRLAPGDTAESLIHNYTQSCQAPLSDSIEVTVPGTAQTYLRPDMQLRACLLRVDRLGAPQ